MCIESPITYIMIIIGSPITYIRIIIEPKVIDIEIIIKSKITYLEKIIESTITYYIHKDNFSNDILSILINEVLSIIKINLSILSSKIANISKVGKKVAIN